MNTDSRDERTPDQVGKETMNEKDKLTAEEIGYAFQDLLGFAARVDLENRIVDALTTVRQEVRAEALRDAANIVSRLPVHVSRSGVRKGSDMNGWSSAINQSVIALEAAADSTQRITSIMGKGEDDG